MDEKERIYRYQHSTAHAVFCLNDLKRKYHLIQRKYWCLHHSTAGDTSYCSLCWGMSSYQLKTNVKPVIKF